MKIEITYKAVHEVEDDYFLERDPKRLEHNISEVLKIRLARMLPSPSEVDAKIIVSPAISTNEVSK